MSAAALFCLFGELLPFVATKTACPAGRIDLMDLLYGDLRSGFAAEGAAGRGEGVGLPSSVSRGLPFFSVELCRALGEDVGGCAVLIDWAKGWLVRPAFSDRLFDRGVEHPPICIAFGLAPSVAKGFLALLISPSHV